MLVNLQSLYWFAIGRRGVLSLGGWTPHVQSGFHEPESTLGLTDFRLQGFHLLRPRIPTRSFGLSADPLSLAATHGVAVAFLSSGYLDVSVPRVRLTHLCIQCVIPPKGWVAPFRNPRISACFQLPWAYRRLPRLSSPLDAKSSTVCPYWPDHTCLKPHSRHQNSVPVQVFPTAFADGRRLGIRGFPRTHAARFEILSSPLPLGGRDGHSFLSGCQ